MKMAAVCDTVCDHLVLNYKEVVVCDDFLKIMKMDVVYDLFVLKSIDLSFLS